MSLKFKSVALGEDFKGYSVYNGEHALVDYNSETDTFSYGDDEPWAIFDTQILADIYGSTHRAAFLGTDENIQMPPDIKITEHNLALVALRMTCEDVANIIRKKDGQSLETTFVQLGLRKLGLPNTPDGQSELEYVGAPRFLYHLLPFADIQNESEEKAAQMLRTMQSTKTLALSDHARTVLSEDIPFSEDVSPFEKLHDRIQRDKGTFAPHLASAQHVYLTMLFTEATGQTTELPLSRHQTADDVSNVIYDHLMKIGF